MTSLKQSHLQDNLKASLIKFSIHAMGYWNHRKIQCAMWGFKGAIERLRRIICSLELHFILNNKWYCLELSTFRPKFTTNKGLCYNTSFCRGDY